MLFQELGFVRSQRRNANVSVVLYRKQCITKACVVHVSAPGPTVITNRHCASVTHIFVMQKS